MQRNLCKLMNQYIIHKLSLLMKTKRSIGVWDSTKHKLRATELQNKVLNSPPPPQLIIINDVKE